MSQTTKRSITPGDDIGTPKAKRRKSEKPKANATANAQKYQQISTE